MSTGGEQWKLGVVVEPVILQVVCRNMWKEIPLSETIIGPSHVPTGGKVAQSLANFYAGCVKSVSTTVARERAARKWIGEKLIVGGYRNQVLDASRDGAGLGADIVEALVRTHLIRREDRGDRVWYELAHDRLVDPVRADNRRWEEENLHWVQKRADLWRTQEQLQSLLLIDEDLAKAEQWILESQPNLTSVEDAFLRNSREEQKVRNKIRRWTTFAWIVACVATVLFFASTFLY